MVRYPHIAIISNDNGEVVDGEYTSTQPTTQPIQGRFEASNSNSRIKLNNLGNEVIVRGIFYCNQSISGNKIEIESLGISSKIICIEKFQTYTAIYV